MTQIRFLVNYRGVLTHERYYQAGDVAELDNATALVDEGRAEFFDHGSVIESKPIIIHNRLGLEELTRKQLRALAKEAGLSRYGQLNKAALIAQLRDNHD